MSLQGFLRKVCTQTATYWGSPTPDGYGGTTYADPVELKVRWDGVNKLITDAKGKEVVSRAEVLVAGQLEDDGSVIPVDLEVDGRLYLGAIDDLDSDNLDSPINIDGAWAIKRVDKNPEFRSTSRFIRTVYL